MGGQRVLVSGMGSELGSLIASLLEAEPWVGDLEGIDVDPPRRRLRRARFHLIDPRHRERVVEKVTAFNPHVLVHVAVWEPDARVGTTIAKRLTDDAATSIIGAAAECPALEHIVVRSGTEIYGRSRNALTRPDETAPIRPTSEFGRMLAGIETVARDVGDLVGATVASVRCATILGPHVPSPLGRLLRMPAVPFSALADPPFMVLRDLDAARALIAAAHRGLDEPINVAASGAITAWQALRHGRRLPLPTVGPEWLITRRVSQLLGAPVPEHVVETLHRGRLVDATRTSDVLGISPTATTTEIIESLYAWPSIVRVTRDSLRAMEVGAA